MRSQLGAFPRKMYSLEKKHLSIHNFYVVQWHWCCLRNLINFWRTLYMYSKHIPTDLLNIFFSYYLHHFRTNWAALPVIHNIATVFFSYLIFNILTSFEWVLQPFSVISVCCNVCNATYWDYCNFIMLYIYSIEASLSLTLFGKL